MIKMTRDMQRSGGDRFCLDGTRECFPEKLAFVLDLKVLMGL